MKGKHRQVLRESATSFTIAADVIVFRFYSIEWEVRFGVWGMGYRDSDLGVECGFGGVAFGAQTGQSSRSRVQ